MLNEKIQVGLNTKLLRMRAIRGSPDELKIGMHIMSRPTCFCQNELSGFRGTDYFNNKAGGVLRVGKYYKAVAPIDWLVLFYP